MIVEAKGDLISLSGSLTHNHWLTIKAACNLLLKQHPEGIIINCAAISDCTDNGAHTIGDAIHFIESAKARIILVNVPQTVLSVLQNVPGVRSSIYIARSIDEARNSLKLGSWGKSPDQKVAPVVMVPLLGSQQCEHTVHQAATVAKERSAILYLVVVLEVPRALALNAPLAEQEQNAQQLIEKAEALVRKEGIQPVRYLKRGREYTAALLEAAADLKADVIVLDLPAPGPAAVEQNGNVPANLVETLCRRAPCEVIISRPSPNKAPANGAATGNNTTFLGNGSRDTQRLPE
jgi:anti-anti-sigma regulatory factor